MYIFNLLQSNFKLRFRRKYILEHRDVPHTEGTSNCAGHRMTVITMRSITTCNSTMRSSWICQIRSARQKNFPASLSESPLSFLQKFPLLFFALNQINLSRTTVPLSFVMPNTVLISFETRVSETVPYIKSFRKQIYAIFVSTIRHTILAT